MNVLPLYQYTDKELKNLLSTLIVLIDTREQANEHVTDYFDSKRIQHKKKKLDVGDYAAMIPKNVELGIQRDMYFPVVIERKNSIDELASSIKEERFENELIRSQKFNFLLVVEDAYAHLVNGRYRSQYQPQALLARLKTFEARYGFHTTFMDKKFMGNFIFHHLYYQARNLLKG